MFAIKTIICLMLGIEPMYDKHTLYHLATAPIPNIICIIPVLQLGKLRAQG
jgi:hypothetical protein